MRKLAIGLLAALLVTFAHADENVSLGPGSLSSVTTGVSLVAIGQDALHDVTSGYDDTCVGAHACYYTTTGHNLSGFGAGALYFNTTGYNNSAGGVNALRFNTIGFNNSAFGYTPLYNNTEGYQNSAFGMAALAANTIGDNNSAFGVEALKQNTDGNSNTALGVLALYNLTNYSNATGLGYNAQVTGSNQVQLGNSSTTVYAYGAVQNRSDARDKYDVRDTRLGLDFINALRPVDFRYDYREDYPDWVSDGSRRRPGLHHGLIAQEVRTVLDRTGVEFGGYRDIAAEGGKDVQTIGYTELIGPMIRAIQELSARVETCH
jgi:hypothetical protein